MSTRRERPPFVGEPGGEYLPLAAASTDGEAGREAGREAGTDGEVSSVVPGRAVFTESGDAVSGVVGEASDCV